ncbi:hypothetical protein SprV_0200808200 [Sparganum proliferum]
MSQYLDALELWIYFFSFPSIKQPTMPNMNLRAYDSLDQPPDAPEQSNKAFMPIVLVAQIAGLLAVILSIVWMGLYAGGFDWSQPDTVFNYHPVFMVLGLVFCFGDAMLVYRVFRMFPKLPVKVVHAILMLLSLLFAVVGLKAAFDSHNLRGIPNLYSIHSWVGITVVVLFALQWIIGLITFLVPSVPMRVRANVLPVHTSMGMIIFTGAICACISGITEKNFFSKSYSALNPAEQIGNALGVALAIFGALVIYLVSRYDYRRQEPPSAERTGFAALN